MTLEKLSVGQNICQIESTIRVDTGRKLNVHKTFRRRPGHLLNVLCTFNLRAVSTGILAIQNESKHFAQHFFVSEKPNLLYRKQEASKFSKC